MTNITNGLIVTAHHGACSMGGMFICETFLNGKVIKVDEKSFRAEFTEEIHTTNGKETSRCSVKTTATFSFWKTLSDGKSVYASKIGTEKYIITL